MSIKDMLDQEIALMQEKRSGLQSVMSLDSRIKGLVVVKVTNPDLCPIKLVTSIFERIKHEKLACSRHIIRIIPLKYVFFPNADELKQNSEKLINDEFGVIAEADESSEQVVKRARIDENQVFPPYCIQFKARNHNTLTRTITQNIICPLMPKAIRVDFRNPQVFICTYTNFISMYRFISCGIEL